LPTLRSRVRDSSPAFPLARPPAGGAVALRALTPRSAGSGAYWPTTEAPDSAATSGLSEAITELLPALEQFTRFDGEDLAGRRSIWQAKLDEPLPVQGSGPQAVLDTLRSVIVPYRLRLGAPGFAGWVNTMPTTITTAAHFAGMVSAPVRAFVTLTNFIEDLALRWLRELLHIPATHQGLFTSGGSVANRHLAEGHVYVREPRDPTRLRMANPFSAVPTAFTPSIAICR
jgi:hypothetical protein